MNGFVQDVYNRGKHSALCVGLDTSYDEALAIHARNLRQLDLDKASAVTHLNQEKIEATYRHAAAYKLNLVSYCGWTHDALQKTVGFIKEAKRRVPSILDAKFAHPAHTNEKAAKWAFDELGVDAVTVMPNPGEQGLEPFLERAKTDGKGVIVVCRMSHEGAREYYDDIVNMDDFSKEVCDQMPKDVYCLLRAGMPLYAKIALTVAWDWNIHYGNCALVVGCTDEENAKHLAFVRSLVGEMLILVPGFGQQGKGTLKEQAARIAQAGRTATGDGILVNAGRSLRPDPQDAEWRRTIERLGISHNDALNIARMKDISIPEGVERPEFLRTRTKSQRTSLLVRDSDAYP